MAVYLISGATVGDAATVTDGAYIENAADDIKAIGWSGELVDLPVLSSGESGRFVSLDLSGDYPAPPATAVSLTLSGPPIVIASLGETAALGEPAVDNAADALYPRGFDSFQYGPKSRATPPISATYLTLDLEGSYTAPTAIVVGMYLDGKPLAAGLTLGVQTSFGTADVDAPLSIRPRGFEVDGIAGEPVFNRGENGASVLFDLTEDYQSPPGTALSLPLSGSPLIVAGFGDQQEFGEQSVRNLAQAAYPSGIDSDEFGTKVRAYPSDHESGCLALDLSGNYEPPSASAVQIFWAGEDKALSPSGFTELSFGSTIVRVSTLFLDGIFEEAFGESGIRNRNRKLAPESISKPRIDTHHVVENTAVPVYPEPIEHPEFESEPHVYNSDQYWRLKGENQERFGELRVSGGVEFLEIEGWSALSVPSPVILNTTADREISLKGTGIEAIKLPEPSVSPRILHVVGIHETELGIPLVQFPPFPVGWLSSSTGTPDIDYWTKYARPDGIDPTENIGYPVIRDKARKVYPPSLVDTAVFGDILIENTSFVVTVDGFYAARYSDYSEIRSNRRAIVGRGYDAQLYGDAQLKNKTPSFAPVGNDLSEFGAPAIGYQIRYIYGRGFTLDSYGHAVLTQTPSFAPHGFESLVIGDHNATHGERTVEMEGEDAQTFGEVTVWFRVRGTDLEGFTLQAYGEPIIEFKNRGIWGEGKATDRHGRPWVSNANQRVEPEGIFKEFAVVHMVGGLRFLEAFGFEATRFGKRVIPRPQAVYPFGFSERFGQQTIFNHTHILYPEGPATVDMPTGRWGKGGLYNLTQYIDMYYFVESQLNPPAWPRWTLIENRSKTIGAIGQNKQLFGYATLEHNARVITYKGIKAPETPEFYEAGMVAYRIRRLPLQGMEPPYMGGWSRIYNDAFVIAPKGYDAGLYGDAELENTRRYFNWIGGFLSQAMGEVMIADRVRKLTFERRYSIGPPRIQLHTVDLYTRYVEPDGDDMGPVGLPSLSIHFNRVRTRWTHRELFGWATLKNLTPELLTRGRASDVFGENLVRLEWRPVEPDGSGMQLFGETLIADRDRSLSVSGLNAGAVSDKLVVIKGGQPPYTEQDISLDGNGISFPGAPYGQLPDPSLNQYVLYAKGFEADRFGEAFFQSNAIIVDHGIRQREDVGRPYLGLKNREVGAESAGDFHAIGKPRVSPHTIWATTDTPPQAAANNPGRGFRPVGQTPTHPAGERFGRPAASTYVGKIRQRFSRRFSAVGIPKLQLKKRYVRPTGIRVYRMGWHSLGDGTQEVKLLSGIFDSEFGEHLLERPPYTGPQDIFPEGMIGGLGRGRVEHLHREFFAHGRDSLAMGRSRGNDPYMWQGLRIGPLMPTIPEGFDPAEHGEPWISYKVREFHMEGFDSFRSEYELENFNARMRVRNSYIPTPPDQEVRPVGVDVSGFGAPNIRQATHYILPDGNADQYRKGAPE